jgi:Flp pilus assembly protein TadD
MSGAEQPFRRLPEIAPNQRVEELVEVIQHARQLLERGDLHGGLTACQQIARQHLEPAQLKPEAQSAPAESSRPEADRSSPASSVQRPRQTDGRTLLCERALRRLDDGNKLGALEDFRRAVALAPQDPELHNNIGVICFELGRLEEARAAFEHAIEVEPDYLAARLNLIDLDLTLDRNEEARLASRDLLEQTNDPEPALKLAECALRTVEQALDLALDDCRSAVGHAPTLASLRLACRRLSRARAALTLPADG